MSTTGVPAPAVAGDPRPMSEPKGRGAAWTEERGASDEGRRRPKGAPQASGKLQRADAQRNYARLLSAAMAAFTEHGADDTSLEEIARRAGVGIGTLYRHFPTRQALLEAVYRDQVEAMRARADELLAAVPPGEALFLWLRDLLEFGRTKRMLTRALLTTLNKDSELMSACSSMMRGAATEILASA